VPPTGGSSLCSARDVRRSWSPTAERQSAIAAWQTAFRRPLRYVDSLPRGVAVAVDVDQTRRVDDRLAVGCLASLRLDGQRLLAPMKSPHCCPLGSLVFDARELWEPSIASSPPTQNPSASSCDVASPKLARRPKVFPGVDSPNSFVERSAIRTQRVRLAGREATLHQSPGSPLAWARRSRVASGSSPRAGAKPACLSAARFANHEQAETRFLRLRRSGLLSPSRSTSLLACGSPLLGGRTTPVL
jgi:hypothetical protein